MGKVLLFLERIAIGQIGLRVGARLVVVVAMVQRNGTAKTVLPVEKIMIAENCLAVGHPAFDCALRHPDEIHTTTANIITVFWSLVVAQVIDIDSPHHPFLVRHFCAENLRQIAILSTIAHLGIADISFGVLFFQIHVHHIPLVAHVALHDARGDTSLVIDLDFAHRVGRQVLQRHLRTAAEEVASVHEQALDFLAVHENLSVLRQLRPRQPAHQRVEHRALGQIEGVGVIDNRVAPHHHLDFRRLHGHFGQVVKRLHHPNRFHADKLLTVAAQLEVHVSVDVALHLGLHDVSTHFLNRKLIVGGAGIGAEKVFAGNSPDGVDNDAVGGHQRDEGGQSVFGKTVENHAANGVVVFFGGGLCEAENRENYRENDAINDNA